ncbi:hydantoinase/oxoprolinase family protein [Planococcus halotolerans]|uniref:Hydantoinase/oxoprolinase family protein n=1 Tax=Planococcus halotolerans TaxID=2233542 RepID=A0A365KWX0_9BACL|nr:hydantoinase/oxoprolinase family protein [Planococcus halotolerans]QHJ69119.1 hydantoinase/oxoprolinase family protein [Planococcus halotolerans]RAZ77682.1 hydantoinase/oxoprolinase family protein [Planococcus halotolerans]
MRIATDIGGTFTDLVYVDENGKVGVAKSHTTPPNFEQGIIDVIEKSGIDQQEIETFIHGTTVIINALTERKGVKTGLITTKGFRDVLEIARGNRPDLFNVRYEKPVPFVERYLRQEVEERLNQKGEVVIPLNIGKIKELIAYFKREQVEALAVSYLHSYKNPEHEELTVELIRELWPEVAVTASHEVTKEWREYERTNTAVLNSYVKPIASKYIDKLNSKLVENDADSFNYIMQSNGGTTTFEQAKKTPINMVESGPVAGIYGAAYLGEIIGEKNVIAFDIGGTTAKCSLISNGEVKVSTDYYIEKDDLRAGYPIKSPVVDIVEIGNGGGSIAWIDEGGSLKVGPQSAGAVPGPVAYGQGGTEPTTTDANLLTGRLSPENFDYTVDMKLVKKAIHDKVAKVYGMTEEEGALGIIRIANANMLNALKLISVRKGYDPRDFTLVAFGGGGSMHAPALARELGVKKVVVPVASSVFSAWGMLMTDLRHDYIQTYINRFEDLDLAELNNQWDKLETQAKQQYAEENIKEEEIIFNRFVDMRYSGQEHTVKVPLVNGEIKAQTVQEVIRLFHEMHEQNFTFKLEEAQTEIVNLHLTAFGTVQKPELQKLETGSKDAETALKETRQVFYEDEGWNDTKVYHRTLLAPGMKIQGPAIVEEPTATTVFYSGQTLSVDAYGNLLIEMGAK